MSRHSAGSLQATGVGHNGGMTRPLGEIVREFRRRAGFTQRELADLAGLSIAVLRDVEQGRVAKPRPATVRRLADALELSSSDRDALVRTAVAGFEPNQLKVGVLGPLLVEAGGVRLAVGSRRQALLGLLALSNGAPVPRDAIVHALWGGDSPANAVDLLLTDVSRARRRLVEAGVGDGALTATHGGYQLRADQLDSQAFRDLVAQARRERAAGDLAKSCESFAAAMRLWRGDVLADLQGLVRGHPEVESLAAERREVVLEYAEVATDLGRHDEVVPLVRIVAAKDPLDERVHAALVIALAGNGQRDAALRVYEDVRERLLEELGADPGSELESAHRQVLRHEIARAEPASVSAHAQLPPDIADFTGRESEIEMLRRRVSAQDGGATAVVISAIEGMGGVGKTRLGVHVAQQLLAAGRCQDTQLYVDLRGHAEQPPADPSAVLASFLRLLGVPRDQIPRDIDGRAALYRDRLYDKDALVLLDNAADDDQVTPLVPAGPRNLVLITSRRTLALDGAYALSLDAFTVPEAESLLAHTVGTRRLEAERTHVRDVIELCGRLPLAVALAARRMQARPRWRFADLAERLRRSDDRIDELGVGGTRLHAVFDLSYQALDDVTQRTFRVLGLYPGQEFAADSVAALGALSRDSARRLLESLVDEHLLAVTSGDRYRMHDLLRDYSLRLAKREETDDERCAAFARLLNHYTHACDAARKKLVPYDKDRITLAGPLPDTVRAYTDGESAFRWFDAERPAIVEAINQAYRRGHLRAAWQLAVMLRNYFERTSSWDEWLSTGETGLAAAREAEDRDGEALLLNHLGVAYGQMGQPDQAERLIVESLGLHRTIGDKEGEALCLNNLGIAVAMLGRYDDALDTLRQALAITEAIGMPPFEATVLGNLGQACADLGRYEEAIRHLRPALAIRRSVGDIVGVALTMHSLGEAELAVGRADQAVSWLRQASELHREAHCRVFEANALDALGSALRAIGKENEARECWQQGGLILTEIGHPRADEMLARVAQTV